MMERILKFEELDQEKINAVNSCLIDHCKICGTPEVFKDHRILVELVQTKLAMDLKYS